MPRFHLKFGFKVSFVSEESRHGSRIRSTNNPLNPLGVGLSSDDSELNQFENTVFRIETGYGDVGHDLHTRRVGEDVTFGSLVRLRHVASNSLVCINWHTRASLEKTAHKITLEPITSNETKHSRWRILPRYKVRSEGHKVCDDDVIILQSVSSGTDWFLHLASESSLEEQLDLGAGGGGGGGSGGASSPALVSPSAFAAVAAGGGGAAAASANNNLVAAASAANWLLEINGSSASSGFRINFFDVQVDAEASEVDLFRLRCGDCLQFFHREHCALISSEAVDANPYLEPAPDIDELDDDDFGGGGDGGGGGSGGKGGDGRAGGGGSSGASSSGSLGATMVAAEDDGEGNQKRQSSFPSTSLFLVESSDVMHGGYVLFGARQFYRLKCLSTGLYICLRHIEDDSSDAEPVPSLSVTDQFEQELSRMRRQSTDVSGGGFGGGFVTQDTSQFGFQTQNFGQAADDRDNNNDNDKKNSGVGAGDQQKRNIDPLNVAAQYEFVMTKNRNDPGTSISFHQAGDEAAVRLFHHSRVFLQFPLVAPEHGGLWLSSGDRLVDASQLSPFSGVMSMTASGVSSNSSFSGHSFGDFGSSGGFGGADPLGEVSLENRHRLCASTIISHRDGCEVLKVPGREFQDLVSVVQVLPPLEKLKRHLKEERTHPPLHLLNHCKDCLCSLICMCTTSSDVNPLSRDGPPLPDAQQRIVSQRVIFLLMDVLEELLPPEMLKKMSATHAEAASPSGSPAGSSGRGRRGRASSLISKSESQVNFSFDDDEAAEQLRRAMGMKMVSSSSQGGSGRGGGGAGSEHDAGDQQNQQQQQDEEDGENNNNNNNNNQNDLDDEIDPLALTSPTMKSLTAASLRLLDLENARNNVPVHNSEYKVPKQRREEDDEEEEEDETSDAKAAGGSHDAGTGGVADEYEDLLDEEEEEEEEEEEQQHNNTLTPQQSQDFHHVNTSGTGMTLTDSLVADSSMVADIVGGPPNNNINNNNNNNNNISSFNSNNNNDLDTSGAGMGAPTSTDLFGKSLQVSSLRSATTLVDKKRKPPPAIAHVMFVIVQLGFRLIRAVAISNERTSYQLRDLVPRIFAYCSHPKKRVGATAALAEIFRDHPQLVDAEQAQTVLTSVVELASQQGRAASQALTLLQNLAVCGAAGIRSVQNRIGQDLLAPAVQVLCHGRSDSATDGGGGKETSTSAASGAAMAAAGGGAASSSQIPPSAVGENSSNNNNQQQQENQQGAIKTRADLHQVLSTKTTGATEPMFFRVFQPNPVGEPSLIMIDMSSDCERAIEREEVEAAARVAAARARFARAGGLRAGGAAAAGSPGAGEGAAASSPLSRGGRRGGAGAPSPTKSGSSGTAAAYLLKKHGKGRGASKGTFTIEEFLEHNEAGFGFSSNKNISDASSDNSSSYRSSSMSDLEQSDVELDAHSRSRLISTLISPPGCLYQQMLLACAACTGRHGENIALVRELYPFAVLYELARKEHLGELRVAVMQLILAVYVDVDPLYDLITRSEHQVFLWSDVQETNREYRAAQSAARGGGGGGTKSAIDMAASSQQQNGDVDQRQANIENIEGEDENDEELDELLGNNSSFASRQNQQLDDDGNVSFASGSFASTGDNTIRFFAQREAKRLRQQQRRVRVPPIDPMLSFDPETNVPELLKAEQLAQQTEYMQSDTGRGVLRLLHYLQNYMSRHKSMHVLERDENLVLAAVIKLVRALCRFGWLDLDDWAVMVELIIDLLDGRADQGYKNDHARYAYNERNHAILSCKMVALETLSNFATMIRSGLVQVLVRGFEEKRRSWLAAILDLRPRSLIHELSLRFHKQKEARDARLRAREEGGWAALWSYFDCWGGDAAADGTVGGAASTVAGETPPVVGAGESTEQQQQQQQQQNQQQNQQQDQQNTENADDNTNQNNNQNNKSDSEMNHREHIRKILGTSKRRAAQDDRYDFSYLERLFSVLLDNLNYRHDTLVTRSLSLILEITNLHAAILPSLRRVHLLTAPANENCYSRLVKIQARLRTWKHSSVSLQDVPGLFKLFSKSLKKEVKTVKELALRGERQAAQERYHILVGLEFHLIIANIVVRTAVLVNMSAAAESLLKAGCEILGAILANEKTVKTVAMDLLPFFKEFARSILPSYPTTMAPIMVRMLSQQFEVARRVGTESMESIILACVAWPNLPILPHLLRLVVFQASAGDQGDGVITRNARNQQRVIQALQHAIPIHSFLKPKEFFTNSRTNHARVQNVLDEMEREEDERDDGNDDGGMGASQFSNTLAFAGGGAAALTSTAADPNEMLVRLELLLTVCACCTGRGAEKRVDARHMIFGSRIVSAVESLLPMLDRPAVVGVPFTMLLRALFLEEDSVLGAIVEGPGGVLEQLLSRLRNVLAQFANEVRNNPMYMVEEDPVFAARDSDLYIDLPDAEDQNNNNNNDDEKMNSSTAVNLNNNNSAVNDKFSNVSFAGVLEHRHDQQPLAAPAAGDGAVAGAEASASSPGGFSASPTTPSATATTTTKPKRRITFQDESSSLAAAGNENNDQQHNQQQNEQQQDDDEGAFSPSPQQPPQQQVAKKRARRPAEETVRRRSRRGCSNSFEVKCYHALLCAVPCVTLVMKFIMDGRLDVEENVITSLLAIANDMSEFFIHVVDSLPVLEVGDDDDEEDSEWSTAPSTPAAADNADENNTNNNNNNNINNMNRNGTTPRGSGNEPIHGGDSLSPAGISMSAGGGSGHRSASANSRISSGGGGRGGDSHSSAAAAAAQNDQQNIQQNIQQQKPKKQPLLVAIGVAEDIRVPSSFTFTERPTFEEMPAICSVTQIPMSCLRNLSQLMRCALTHGLLPENIEDMIRDRLEKVERIRVDATSAGGGGASGGAGASSAAAGSGSDSDVDENGQLQNSAAGGEAEDEITVELRRYKARRESAVAGDVDGGAGGGGGGGAAAAGGVGAVAKRRSRSLQDKWQLYVDEFERNAAGTVEATAFRTPARLMLRRGMHGNSAIKAVVRTIEAGIVRGSERQRFLQFLTQVLLIDDEEFSDAVLVLPKVVDHIDMAGLDDKIAHAVRQRMLSLDKTLLERQNIMASWSGDASLPPKLIKFISRSEEGITRQSCRCLHAMLANGNRLVQQRVLNFFLDSQTEAFFAVVRSYLLSLRENLQERQMMIEDETQDQNLPFATPAIIAEIDEQFAAFNELCIMLLEVVRLLAEGHFRAFQEYCLRQPDNQISVNLVEQIIEIAAQLILTPQPLGVDFLVADIALQAFSTLTELVQGPCAINQRYIISQNIGSLVTSVFTDEHRFLAPAQKHELQKSAIILLQSLLEGHTNRRMFSMLCSSLSFSSLADEMDLLYATWHERSRPELIATDGGAGGANGEAPSACVRFLNFSYRACVNFFSELLMPAPLSDEVESDEMSSLNLACAIFIFLRSILDVEYLLSGSDGAGDDGAGGMGGAAALAGGGGGGGADGAGGDAHHGGYGAPAARGLFPDREMRSIVGVFRDSSSFKKMARMISTIEIVRPHGGAGSGGGANTMMLPGGGGAASHHQSVTVERFYFRTPLTMKVNLQEDSKRRVLDEVDRAGDGARLQSFFEKCFNLHEEMNQLDKLRRTPFLSIIHKSSQFFEVLSLVFALVINFVIVAFIEWPNAAGGEETVDELPAGPITEFYRALGIMLMIVQTVLFLNFLSGTLRIHLNEEWRAWEEELKVLAIRASKRALSVIPPKIDENAKKQLSWVNRYATNFWWTILYPPTYRYIFFAALPFLGFFMQDGTGAIFFAFTPLNIVFVSPALYNVILAVSTNAYALGLTFAFLLILLNVFAVIFYFNFSESLFPDDENRGAGMACDSMVRCLSTVILYGLRSGGDFMYFPTYTEQNSFSNYYGRLLYELIFFIVLIMLVLNLVFGIVLDTFSSLRSDRQAIDENQKRQCFVCGLPRDLIDKAMSNSGGFEEHRRNQHSLWAYLAAIIYVSRIPESDLTGAEAFIHQCMQNLSIAFFPLGRSLSVEMQSGHEDNAGGGGGGGLIESNNNASGAGGGNASSFDHSGGGAGGGGGGVDSSSPFSSSSPLASSGFAAALAHAAIEEAQLLKQREAVEHETEVTSMRRRLAKAAGGVSPHVTTQHTRGVSGGMSSLASPAAGAGAAAFGASAFGQQQQQQINTESIAALSDRMSSLEGSMARIEQLLLSRK